MIMQTSLFDQLLRGDLFSVVIKTFESVVPIPLFALLVFGSIGTGYYMVQRSAAIPAVMAILVGGVTIARFPTNVQSGIVALLVLAVAGVGYTLLQRVEV